MRGQDDDLCLRSFRVCFDLERRLHRIDRFRIPLPYGMPVRGILYGAAILLAVLVGGQLPLLGGALGALHPIIRYGALPVGGGYALTELRVDGRSGHAVVASWLRMQLQPRRIAAFRSAPPPGRVVLAPIVIAPDERGGRLRRGVVEGSGRLVVRAPAQLTTRRGTLRVRPEDGAPLRRGTQIALRRGQRVVIA